MYQETKETKTPNSTPIAPTYGELLGGYKHRLTIIHGQFPNNERFRNTQSQQTVRFKFKLGEDTES